MAVVKPYYTSNDLIEAVKRKIHIPISQITFTEEDILHFANEEMMLSQVPSVLLYHEEYFVYRIDTPLLDNTSRYPIPSRAIGMRLSDVMYSDISGNLFEMTRIDSSDKAFFQRNVGANQAIHKFYLENNDVVLLPQLITGPTGSLAFFIFLRPNQLVANDRAAILLSKTPPTTEISQNFLANSTYVQVDPVNTFTISNHGLNDGNKVTITTTGQPPAPLITGNLYYVVTSTTNTFQLSETIGGSPITITDVGSGIHSVNRLFTLTQPFAPDTVDFINNTITIPDHDYANNDKVLLSSSGNLPTPFVTDTIYYIVNATPDTIQLSTVVGGPAINITYVGTGLHNITSDITTLNFDQVPENITSSSLIDFLQTDQGHKTFTFDILIPANGVGGNSILLQTSQVPENFLVGDYVCSANECIIPQIPSDLHSGLAERTCARILSAQGDTAGLQASQAKITEIENRQGTLLDQRVEGAPRKVLARHNLLRYFKMSGSRRF